MKRLSSHQLWFLSAIMISLITLGVLFAPAAQAQSRPERPPQTRWAANLPAPLADQQIFNEDFTVESGQLIEDNVAVFRGDVEIEEGGIIRGDLSVFGGDVSIAGTVEGNLAVMGGDVELKGTARHHRRCKRTGRRSRPRPRCHHWRHFCRQRRN